MKSTIVLQYRIYPPDHNLSVITRFSDAGETLGISVNEEMMRSDDEASDSNESKK